MTIVYAGLDSVQTSVFTDTLANYVGKWLHVVVEFTCELNTRFHIRISQKDNSTELMNFTDTIDMWRPGNEFMRPKWGIYRGLGNRENLRDENVLFNNFCLSKTEPLCD